MCRVPIFVLLCSLVERLKEKTMDNEPEVTEDLVCPICHNIMHLTDFGEVVECDCGYREEYQDDV